MKIDGVEERAGATPNDFDRGMSVYSKKDKGRRTSLLEMCLELAQEELQIFAGMTEAQDDVGVESALKIMTGREQNLLFRDSIQQCSGYQ